MRSEIVNLINNGFYKKNLLKLTELCNANFEENPVLFGTLAFVFLGWHQKYEGQATTGELNNTDALLLKQPILNLLEAEGAPPEVFLDRLSVVYRAYRDLRS